MALTKCQSLVRAASMRLHMPQMVQWHPARWKALIFKYASHHSTTCLAVVGIIWPHACGL